MLKAVCASGRPNMTSLRNRNGLYDDDPDAALVVAAAPQRSVDA